MLVAPSGTRRTLRFLFGMRMPEGRMEYVAAWLLVVLGLAVALVARVAR
jgi:hypothetical protein